MEMDFAPLEPADFPTLVAWTTSMEFLLQWAGPKFSYPLTIDQLAEHHRECAGPEPAREMWKGMDRSTGAMVAHAELNTIDRLAKCATISRVIVGDPRARGKGIGTQLMSFLVRRAFDVLDLETLDLNVFDFNQRAVDCYRRVGFEIESRLENVRRVGDGYWSLYRMALGRRPAP